MSEQTDSLLALLPDLKMTEIEAMNLLQGRGIISDLCVWIDDIDDNDVERARQFLITMAELRSLKTT